MGGAATFTLNSDGSISTATSRALSRLFSSTSPATPPSAAPPASASPSCSAWAPTPRRNQAVGFRGDRRGQRQSRAALGFASPAITPSSVAGDTIVSAGDNSGAIALQNVITNDRRASMPPAASPPRPRRCRTMPRPSTRIFPPNRTPSPPTRPPRTTGCRKPMPRVSSNSGVNLDEELTDADHLSAGLYRRRAHADGGGPALSDPAADPVRTEDFAMSIDRVATAAQTAYFLSQIQNAGAALDKTQAADRLAARTPPPMPASATRPRC